MGRQCVSDDDIVRLRRAGVGHRHLVEVGVAGVDRVGHVDLGHVDRCVRRHGRRRRGAVVGLVVIVGGREGLAGVGDDAGDIAAHAGGDDHGDDLAGVHLAELADAADARALRGGTGDEGQAGGQDVLGIDAARVAGTDVGHDERVGDQLAGAGGGRRDLTDGQVRNDLNLALRFILALLLHAVGVGDVEGSVVVDERAVGRGGIDAAGDGHDAGRIGRHIAQITLDDAARSTGDRRRARTLTERCREGARHVGHAEGNRVHDFGIRAGDGATVAHADDVRHHRAGRDRDRPALDDVKLVEADLRLVRGVVVVDAAAAGADVAVGIGKQACPARVGNVGDNRAGRNIDVDDGLVAHDERVRFADLRSQRREVSLQVRQVDRVGAGRCHIIRVVVRLPRTADVGDPRRQRIADQHVVGRHRRGRRVVDAQRVEDGIARPHVGRVGRLLDDQLRLDQVGGHRVGGDGRHGIACQVAPAERGRVGVANAMLVDRHVLDHGRDDRGNLRVGRNLREVDQHGLGRRPRGRNIGGVDVGGRVDDHGGITDHAEAGRQCVGHRRRVQVCRNAAAAGECDRVAEGLADGDRQGRVALDNRRVGRTHRRAVAAAAVGALDAERSRARHVVVAEQRLVRHADAGRDVVLHARRHSDDRPRVLQRIVGRRRRQVVDAPHQRAGVARRG